MHPSTNNTPFTVGDIPFIKQKIKDIYAMAYDGKFNFAKYQEKKLITVEERIIMVAYAKKMFPIIGFDPIPSELRPLIRIAQDLIREERTTPIPRRTDDQLIDEAFNRRIEADRFRRAYEYRYDMSSRRSPWKY